MRTITPARPEKTVPIKPPKPVKPHLPKGLAGYQTCGPTFPTINPSYSNPALTSIPIQ